MSWPPPSKERELAAARRTQRKRRAKARRNGKRKLRVFRTVKREREEREAMTSVGEDFPRQQERVRKLWGAYVEMGTKGEAAAGALEEVLDKAAKAQSSGEIVQILTAYQELTEVLRLHELLRSRRRIG